MRKEKNSREKNYQEKNYQEKNYQEKNYRNGEPDPAAAGVAGKAKGGALRRGFARLADVRVLAGCGMLSAIAIVLGFFKIPLTQLVELRFAVLPVAAAGYLFGPVCAGAVGLVADVGGYLVRPTGPFFPGFTLSSVLSGVIFGAVLYGRRPSLMRILAAEVLYTLVCGILLNSFWLSLLYGRGFIPALTARLLKELVMIPVNTLMLAALMQPVKRYGIPDRA